MKARHLILFAVLGILLGFSTPSYAVLDIACQHKCLMHGGLPDVCRQKCGGDITNPPPVRPTPPTQPISPVAPVPGIPTTSSGAGGAPHVCYARCVQQAVAATTCENICGIATNTHAPSTHIVTPESQPALEAGAASSDVEFDCFKSCRKAGEALEDCNLLCRL
jgi:hypothetical protein